MSEYKATYHPGTAEGHRAFIERIKSALAARATTPPKCPNCETSIRTVDMVGTACLWSEGGSFPNGYLICRSCWPGISQDRMEKLEDRIIRKPLSYLVSLIESPYQDLAYGNKPIFHMAGDTAWATNDRLWFAENPSRSFRIRPPFDGELFPAPLPAEANAVLVVRLREGARTRLPLTLFDQRLMDELTDDQLAVLYAKHIAPDSSFVGGVSAA